MNKTQIIKKIVGEKLRDYGFDFLKTDGPCRIFMREAHGFKRYYEPETDVVKQYVMIQQSNISRSLTARFYTDVYGNEMARDLEALEKYGTGGWIGYLDEDSYKDRLQLLAGHIIEDGLAYLGELSCEEEAIPTKVMAEKLFDRHKQLAQAFTDGFHIKSVPEKSADIDDWFQFIRKLIIDSSGLPYEDVKELLVKIAAFIGEKACEICQYEWIFPEDFKTPEIITANSRIPYPSLFPLDAIVKIWKHKCDDRFWYFIEQLVEPLKQGLVK